MFLRSMGCQSRFDTYLRQAWAADDVARNPGTDTTGMAVCRCRACGAGCCVHAPCYSEHRRERGALGHWGIGRNRRKCATGQARSTKNRQVS
jgi:hypothetical protein